MASPSALRSSQPRALQGRAVPAGGKCRAGFPAPIHSSFQLPAIFSYFQVFRIVIPKFTSIKGLRTGDRSLRSTDPAGSPGRAPPRLNARLRAARLHARLELQARARQRAHRDLDRFARCRGAEGRIGALFAKRCGHAPASSGDAEPESRSPLGDERSEEALASSWENYSIRAASRCIPAGRKRDSGATGISSRRDWQGNREAG